MSTKEPQSPEIRARRSKAYELYAVTDDQGKRQTLASIALQVGATLTAVKYWKRVDGWDDKVAEAAGAAVAAANQSNQTVRTLLRAGAAEHILTLNAIIKDKRNRPQDRIKGIVEFVKLAKELDALDPLTSTQPANPAPTFSDDVEPPKPVIEEPSDDVRGELHLGSLRPNAADDPAVRVAEGSADDAPVDP